MNNIPICPHCGHTHRDWHEMGLIEGLNINISCESCDKLFSIDMDIDITFKTLPF